MRLSVHLLCRILGAASITTLGPGGLLAQVPSGLSGNSSVGLAPTYGAAPTYYTTPAYTTPAYSATYGAQSSSGTGSVAYSLPATSLPPATATFYGGNGSYQAQRPAYFDNPNVYTGLPTSSGYVADGAMGYATGYSSLRSPLTDSWRGVSTVPGATTFATPYYSSFDGTLPGQPVTITTPVGTPSTAMPATTVAPLFVSPPPSSGNCFSRLCDKMFGTRYATSYYRAPVTFYRPVTSVDPLTGTPVIIQQPCTSFEQQVQRTPYTSLQFGTAHAAPAPAPSCANPCETPTTLSQVNAVGSAAPGAIEQAGLMGSPGGATSIPTIAPPMQAVNGQTGYGQTSYGQTSYGQTSYGEPSDVAPNTQPLIGVPTIAPPTGAGDLAPVGQPSLQDPVAPSILDNNSASSSTPAPTARWQFQKPADSTALIPPQVPAPPPRSEQKTLPLPAPPIAHDDNFTRAEPIEAPSDYVAPYRPHSYQSPRIVPVNQPSSDLPDLQPPSQAEERLVLGSSPLSRVSAQISPLPATLPGRVLDLRK